MTDMRRPAEQIWRLRQDAIERGMQELAIAYGWLALRIEKEIIGRMIADRLGLSGK